MDSRIEDTHPPSETAALQLVHEVRVRGTADAGDQTHPERDQRHGDACVAVDETAGGEPVDESFAIGGEPTQGEICVDPGHTELDRAPLRIVGNSAPDPHRDPIVHSHRPGLSQHAIDRRLVRGEQSHREGHGDVLRVISVNEREIDVA